MKQSLILMVSISMLGISSLSYAMGRIPKKEYEKKVSELEQTKKTSEECDQNLASLQKKSDETKTELQAKVTALETTNGQLLKDLESSKGELQKRVADLVKEKQDVEKEKAMEVEKLKGTYDSLVTDMKKEIQQGSIQITQLQNKLSVSLVDKIVFDSGEAEINEGGKQVLKKVANILKKVKDKQIRIEGHTDNIPIGGSLKEKFPSNWELSTARATTVARYLQDAGGVSPEYLYAAGYGPYHPVADNATAEGRSKNRRIEIALVPKEIASSITQKAAPNLPRKN
ncbi:MAG: OmpA family protein [Elusimicrobia bacterium]|nr:OmpA family protein [Elusimicrobiota bacterium]